MSNKKSQKVENISTRKDNRNELIKKIYNLVMEGQGAEERYAQVTKVNILNSCMMLNPNEDDHEQIDLQTSRTDTEEICKVIDDIVHNENLMYYNMLCYTITLALVKHSGVSSELASILFSLISYDVIISERLSICGDDMVSDDDMVSYEELFRARDCRILLDVFFTHMVDTSLLTRDVFDASKLSYISFMMPIEDIAVLIQKYCPKETRIYGKDYEDIKNTLARFLSQSNYLYNNIDDISIQVHSSIL